MKLHDIEFVFLFVLEDVLHEKEKEKKSEVQNMAFLHISVFLRSKVSYKFCTEYMVLVITCKTSGNSSSV